MFRLTEHTQSSDPKYWRLDYTRGTGREKSERRKAEGSYCPEFSTAPPTAVDYDPSECC